MQHTVSVHFFAVVLHDYNVKSSRNLLVTRFYGGNVIRVLIHFFCFSPPLIFTLVAASISHFLTAATKFSCCSSNKKNVSFAFYYSRVRACRSFSRRASLTCRLLSLYLCLSLYSIFVDMTINASLIL